MSHPGTPGPGRPRQSGIPTPGRAPSAIGRPRSGTASGSQLPTPPLPAESVSKALSDAIKANDPNKYNLSPDSSRPVTRPTSASSVGAQPTTPKTPGFRTKTPTVATPAATSKYAPRQSVASTARPDSRQSDVARVSSRPSKKFEIGDGVRMESLGMEGILRFMGEIEGKPGEYAGVELSGGFYGKGKNDGSVNGVKYFTCPPKCGVFIPISKLSPPTTGPKAVVRPPSVASSRGGRATPASSGRATPSTPFSHISLATPVARPRKSTVPAAAEYNISEGSRASKYVGMTAKQLSSERNGGSSSPTRTPKPSSRPSASTPTSMPAFGKGRLSLATPKATRTPAAVRNNEMPPPSSPSKTWVLLPEHTAKSVTPTFSQTSTDTFVDDDQTQGHKSDDLRALEMNNKVLQDKIASLMVGKSAPPLIDTFSPISNLPVSPPSSVAEIEALHARILTLEQDNARLAEGHKTNGHDANEAVLEQIERLEAEKELASDKISDLEASLKSITRTNEERQAKIESLERAAQLATDQVDKVRSEGELKVRGLTDQLEDRELLIASLKEAVEVKASKLRTENDAVIEAKNAEIKVLEARAKKATVEMEEERKELNAQIDELRLAGQETIALYEERLSTSESRRYDMEDLVQSLTEQVKALQVTRPPSPTTKARYTNTAVEIDNEALRDQVLHLQNKVTTLEDQLEDVQATFDKEETAIKARIVRYKERDGLLKKEVEDSRKEMLEVVKAEEIARARVEECEEALRENGVALENARAEIEGLRAELANLEGLQAENGGTAHPGAGDEVAKLNAALKLARQDATSMTTISKELRVTVETLIADKAELERTCQESHSKLVTERKLVADLRQALSQRAHHSTDSSSLSTDSPSLSPRRSRDLVDDTRRNSVASNSSRHSKEDNLKGQVTGLKHIVQELTKENTTLSSQNKMLESDNKMLQSEAEELRTAVKALEAAMEDSIAQEERALAREEAPASPSFADMDAMKKALKDSQVKYEAELDQLRKKLSEVEKKSARTIHDLNKEVSELETLIEAKIYREDDLERELEKCKEKLARAQKSGSRASGESGVRSRPLSTQSINSTSTYDSRSSVITVESATDEVCEICEQPGHDIFSCPLLKDEPGSAGLSAPSTSRPKEGSDPSDLWCEDCESHGHVAVDCPHSLDVF